MRSVVPGAPPKRLDRQQSARRHCDERTKFVEQRLCVSEPHARHITVCWFGFHCHWCYDSISMRRIGRSLHSQHHASTTKHTMTFRLTGFRKSGSSFIKLFEWLSRQVDNIMYIQFCSLHIFDDTRERTIFCINLIILFFWFVWYTHFFYSINIYTRSQPLRKTYMYVRFDGFYNRCAVRTQRRQLPVCLHTFLAPINNDIKMIFSNSILLRKSCKSTNQIIWYTIYCSKTARSHIIV